MRHGLHPEAIAATTDEARAARSLLERLVVRFPDLIRRLSARVVLQRGGRLRRGLIRRSARLTFAAWSRRDWELNTLLLDGDDYEFMVGDPAGQAPGMRERYEGIAGYLEAQTTMLEVFTDMEVALERIGWAPDGRLAGFLRFRGQADASGVAIDQRALIAVEFRRGLAVRQWYWWDVQAGSRGLGIDSPRR